MQLVDMPGVIDALYDVATDGNGPSVNLASMPSQDAYNLVREVSNMVKQIAKRMMRNQMRQSQGQTNQPDPNNMNDWRNAMEPNNPNNIFNNVQNGIVTDQNIQNAQEVDAENLVSNNDTHGGILERDNMEEYTRFIQDVTQTVTLNNHL